MRNWTSRLAYRQKADPECFQVLRLLHDIQDAGGIGLRMEGPTNGLPKVLFFFREDRTEPGVAGKAAEVKQLLGIREGETLFRLVQSPVRAEMGELAIATRSLSQLMEVLSRGVEIPPTHVQRRLLPPTPAAVAEEQPLLHIHSGPDKPDGVFVGVPYEGQWFWIANDDWKSKRTFSSILFLFTLANAGTVQQMPTLTIPAQ